MKCGSCPGSDTPAGRNLQLDGLRAVAFLLVFVHHSLNVPILWCGVDLFFVLSGFLITGILVRDTRPKALFAAFYYRRFLRIFPPYYVVLLLTFALLAEDWRSYWHWYVFFASNFQIALGYRNYADLVPTWSLAVEEQFYLLWPLLVFLLGRRGMWRLCVLLVLAAPAFRLWMAFAFDGYWAAYMLLPSRMDLLAMGGALALLLERSPERFARVSDKGLWLSLAAALAFAGLSGALPEFRHGANKPLFNVLGYSLLALVMLGLVAYFVPRRGNFLGRALRSGPLVYLGTISYFMYLSHQILIHQVAYLGLPRPLSVVASFAYTIFFSALSWRLLEEPLQRLRVRVSAGPPAPAARPAGS